MTAFEQDTKLKIVTYISVNPGDPALDPQREGFYNLWEAIRSNV
jgi:hypothetical protein